MGVSLADFMARVVPWPLPGEDGVINMHWTHPSHSGMGGKPFVQIADFLTMVPWCNTHSVFVKDVYFCLSRQRMVGPHRNNRATALRNAANTMHLKAIWCDIDANKLPPKGYANKDDAITAIIKFLADAGMPPPSALVDSGNGFHVYWISKRALTVDEWRPYAEGLWALMQKHGLHGDPLTTDCVRVLRIPETYNKKTTPAKPVVLKSLGVDYDFDVDLKHLPQVSPVQRAVLPSSNVTLVTGNVMLDPALFPKKDPITDENEILAHDCQPKTLPPLDDYSVISGCPHYGDAIRTGGAGHNQGLWMQTLLGATWFAKGRQTARALGWKHPGYDKDSTDAMFDRKLRDREERGLGWPSCRTFQNNGSTQCKTCPHYGKVRSPLNLGTPAPVHIPRGAANFSVPPPPLGAVDLMLPNNYIINSDGHLCLLKESPLTDAGETTPPKEIQLLKCQIVTPPWAEKGKAGHIFHFTVTSDKGYTEKIAVPMVATHSTVALCLCLADQGCNIAPRGKEFLCDFMTSWIEKMHRASEAQHAVPFGWWSDKGDLRAGFSYGGRTIRKDGTIGPAGNAGNLAKIYTPIGRIEPWFKALKLVTDQHKPALEVIVASGFASPLLAITGQYSGAICACSSDSGNSKSTAVKLALAVWGHPRLTKQVSDSSHKGLLKTMGDIRNLPSISDDVSDPEVMDGCVLTVQSASQGAGGVKLFTNRKQQPREEWDSLMVITSNRSMFDTMVNKIKDTKAAVNRIFEFRVPDLLRDAAGNEIPGQIGRITKWEAEPIVQALEENYGKIGEKFAAMLGGDPDGITKVVNSYSAYFDTKLQIASEERFWSAICATIMAGAHLANICGATFNIDEIKNFLEAEFLTMRDRVGSAFLSGGSEANTTSALTDFIVAYGNKSLRTEDMALPGRGKPKKLTELGGPRDFHQAEVRMHWCVTDRLLRISKGEFTTFLNKTKRSPATVFEGLVKYYNIVKPFPVFDMTAGSTYQGGPEPLIVIPIPPGHWLENGLLARCTLDQIAVIQQGQSAVPTGLAPIAPAPSTPNPGP